MLTLVESKESAKDDDEEFEYILNPEIFTEEFHKSVPYICDRCYENPKLLYRLEGFGMLSFLMTKLPNRKFKIKAIIEEYGLHPASAKRRFNVLCETGHIRFISPDEIELIKICDINKGACE